MIIQESPSYEDFLSNNNQLSSLRQKSTILDLDLIEDTKRITFLRSRNISETVKEKGINSIDIRNFIGNTYQSSSKNISEMSNDDKKLIQSLNNIPYLSDRLREANNRIKSYSKVFFLKSKLMMDVLENLSVNYDKKLKGE